MNRRFTVHLRSLHTPAPPPPAPPAPWTWRLAWPLGAGATWPRLGMPSKQRPSQQRTVNTTTRAGLALRGVRPSARMLAARSISLSQNECTSIPHTSHTDSPATLPPPSRPAASSTQSVPAGPAHPQRVATLDSPHLSSSRLVTTRQTRSATWRRTARH
jgi:hypothetical protein